MSFQHQTNRELIYESEEDEGEGEEDEDQREAKAVGIEELFTPSNNRGERSCIT